MTKMSFTKNLILHIRYPWTAVTLLILWVGLAIMCAILHFSIEEMMLLIGVNAVVTLIIALIGFKG